MRKVLFTFLFALPFLASAQTKTYRIEAPAKDSFFLVETVTAAATKEAPKAQKVESAMLFHSEAQLLNYVQYLKDQANIAREQAKKVVEDAKQKAKSDVESAENKSAELNGIAPKLESAASEIDSVAKASKALFYGPSPTEAKTKKKKKTKS